MLRSRAASVVVVCILICGVRGRARAEDPVPEDLPVPVTGVDRRPVAVIELGNFEPNRKLALELATELNNGKAIKPLDSLIDADALRDAHTDEDKPFLEQAASARSEAEGHVVNYRFPEAASAADRGLANLHSATPTPAMLRLSAELAFLLGAARLGERKPEIAATWFRFAYTLDPGFKPDPIRYLPEIVQAFELSSKSKPGGGGWIEVTGPGRVFLDGKEVGTSPQTFPEITPGIHVVQLIGDDRETHGKRVEVVAGRKSDRLEFEAGTIDRKQEIKRARRALKNAPDPAARAAAMQALARLVGVKDAILLSESNGKTIVQTWRDQAPGFSALRELKEQDKPADLLAPFLPPKPPDPVKKPDRPKLPKIVDTRSWYQKPRYQIGGGVLGAVVLGVAIYALASWQRTLGIDPNAGFEVDNLGSRR